MEYLKQVRLNEMIRLNILSVIKIYYCEFKYIEKSAFYFIQKLQIYKR